jgi:hypothetical protein
MPTLEQFELMQYDGPPAEVASLTGSILIGSPIAETVARFEDCGWRLLSQKRVPTPYGLGPLAHVFRTPSGRNAMWIPFYGHVLGRGRENDIYPKDTFWILREAGVKVIVCGSVHGTADWRSDSERIRPGDVVFPWSFWRQYNQPADLPGTMVGGLYPNLALMGDAYCRLLGEQLAVKIEQDLTPVPLRKVHRPSEVHAFAISPVGGGMTWETDAETNVWRRLMRMVSEDGEKPLVTIFGGTGVNPMLARKIGAHLVHYHVCTDDAHGIAKTSDEVVAHIDRLYRTDLPPVIPRLEAEFIDGLAVPGDDDCTCMGHLRERPRQYLEGMTWDTPSGLPGPEGVYWDLYSEWKKSIQEK